MRVPRTKALSALAWRALSLIALSLIAPALIALSLIALSLIALSSRLCLARDAIATSMERGKNQAEHERRWITRLSRQSQVTQVGATVGAFIQICEVKFGQLLFIDSTVLSPVRLHLLHDA
jgi:phosphate/sulfate permease